jgi:hypothetical protein
MKLNQSELEELIKFTFSKTYNPPKVVLTRGGSPAIIFLQEAKGTTPILGSWWNGEEWIPAKWMKNGKYPSINSKVQTTQLDLMIINPLDKVTA